MFKLVSHFILVSSILTMVSCGMELPTDVADAYVDLPEEVDFSLHVKPILSDKCFFCHGPDKAKQKAGLRLDEPEAAYSRSTESGKRAIVPRKAHQSELVERILSEDPDYVMPDPESHLQLTAHEKAVLVKWIEQGAVYKPHWAFTKPTKPSIPQVVNAKSAVNPIDHFVRSKLEEQKLQPSQEADKHLLLRRLSFDLTGLPPTIEELNGFLDDTSPEAFERQVDRLLATPQYGERMAMDWMDVARFADTHGYTVDRYRDMSPWRDWVIKTFNENMPFDQFILWQMAGDLMDSPTKDQLLATAFNRIHPQNMEGGIIPEEFRVEYVLDRVNTSGQAFMALTLECARCHDHKYDPVSQKDYFAMSAFFNNVNEAGQISWDDAMPVPTMLLTSDEQDKEMLEMEKEISSIERYLDSLSDSSKKEAAKWIETESYQYAKDRQYPEGIMAHYEFEGQSLHNSRNSSQVGIMKQIGSSDEKPEFSAGKTGDGLLLNGDAWFDTEGVGAFRRFEPFSISINIMLPDDLEDGVIFHKGDGAAIYCFKGFHLTLKKNRLELLMAHTAPDNAIIKQTIKEVPRNVWLNLTMTYDGSSRAEGLKIFMDGAELETEIEIDNLYKDIHFDRKKEQGIQVGARWRGKGVGGASVDDLMIFSKELTPLEIAQVANNQRYTELLGSSAGDLSAEEKTLLANYFAKTQNQDIRDVLRKLQKQRRQYADFVEDIQEAMVMKEMPEPRPTYLLERGNYDSYGEQVYPETPETILDMPADLPKNRLGFAKWLVHEDHPLTARVTVNRYWQLLFGRGIVETSEDFGNQGALPSHPELLDWLAVEFRESGWDVKKLMKLMVMSATYRQSSVAGKELLQVDPANVWLARGPSVRLSSEMIRDNVLQASGLLNKEIGGKSVSPYQPANLWKVNGARYQQDTGNKLYRRSMYTIWKRSVPHPTLATFDSPERSRCTMRRQETTTPLQALVLLNDLTFVEGAKVIGEFITRHDDGDVALGNVFTKLTGREASEKEMNILVELRQAELKKFRSNPDKAEGWISAGEYSFHKDLDRNELAANAVVASAIINSDAAIIKR